MTYATFESAPEALGVIARVHENRVKANLQKLDVDCRMGAPSAGPRGLYPNTRKMELWRNLQDSLTTLSDFLKEHKHGLQSEKGRAGP